jgi:hypothetical protein
MKKMITVAVVAVLFAGNAVSDEVEDTVLLKQVYSSVLSGKISKAIELLSAAEDKLTEVEQELKQGLTRRFLTNAEVYPETSGLLGELLKIHRSYWIKVLTGKWSVERGKRELFKGLKRAANSRGKMFGAFTEERYDDVADFLVSELEKEGIHSIMGTVSPYGDIIAWKTQYEKGFKVSLPEGIVQVKVVMMDDFVSFGWIGFATLDHKSAGGWAKEDLLYAVASKYDFESEDFKVSYLAHEARHQQDFLRYPNIEDGEHEPELEYRAKLTELIMSEETTHDLITAFQRQAKLGRVSSHAHASHFAVRNIGKMLSENTGSVPSDWVSIQPDSIRRAAQVLLDQSTRILENWDPDKVEQFLEL